MNRWLLSTNAKGIGTNLYFFAVFTLLLIILFMIGLLDININVVKSFSLGFLVSSAFISYMTKCFKTILTHPRPPRRQMGKSKYLAILQLIFILCQII